MVGRTDSNCDQLLKANCSPAELATQKGFHKKSDYSIFSNNCKAKEEAEFFRKD